MVLIEQSEIKPQTRFCGNVSPDFLGLLFILVITLGFFYKTIFAGQAISKLGLICSVDTFFNNNLKQAIIPFTCDPSGFLIFFPNGHFAQQSWLKLCMPLWNHLSACGYPLLGDPQSFVFSPASFLGFFLSPDMYNFGLLLEILLGLVGVYFLSRFLKLSIFSALLAATAYGFCPYMLAVIDLSGAECFVPWVFLAFARLAEKPSVWSFVFATIISALSAFSAHPEIAFFAIAYGAVLGFVLMVSRKFQELTDSSEQQKDQLAKILPIILKSFAIFFASGILILGLSAPLALPFVELMQHSYLYKDASSVVAYIPFKDFLAAITLAKGENPFFLGIVLIALAPLLVFVRERKAAALLIVASIMCLISFPCDWLLPFLAKPPLSYLALLYGLPELVIVICLAAGMVLDNFSSRKFSLLHWSVFALTIFSIFLTLFTVPDFGQVLPVLRANKSFFLASGISSGIALVLLFLFLRIKHMPVWLMALFMIAANFISESSCARQSLPPVPQYKLEANAPIKFLQETDARMVSVGNQFFLPNLHMNYGIRSLSCFSPLLPTLYKDFVLACGAKCHNLYFYDFPEQCSDLLDLASVKYVMTRSAIGGLEQQANLEVIKSCLPHRITYGLRIVSSNFVYDATNAQIQGNLSLKVHDLASLRYALQFCLFDEQNHELWAGPQERLDSRGTPDHLITQHPYIPVPLTVSANTHLLFGFRVIDTWTDKNPELDNNVSAPISDLCFLGQCVVKKPAQSDIAQAKSHFKLVKEFASGVRIYENLRALPTAYLVPKIRYVLEKDKVLALLDSKDFNPREEAIIVGDENSINILNRNPIANRAPLKVSRPDGNSVLIEAEAAEPSMLVLTDAFYPGWKCSVDKRPVEISCVNYMFRGVMLPAGQHRIVFFYQPDLFQLGLLIATASIACLILLKLFERKSK